MRRWVLHHRLSKAGGVSYHHLDRGSIEKGVGVLGLDASILEGPPQDKLDKESEVQGEAIPVIGLKPDLNSYEKDPILSVDYMK